MGNGSFLSVVPLGFRRQSALSLNPLYLSAKLHFTSLHFAHYIKFKMRVPIARLTAALAAAAVLVLVVSPAEATKMESVLFGERRVYQEGDM